MTWRGPRDLRRDWSVCLACPLVSWLCELLVAAWPGFCSRPASQGCKGSGPSCSGRQRRVTYQFCGPDGRSWTPCAATRSTRASAWRARAREGWLVAGTVGCLGPEISSFAEIPVTSCLEFLWDRPTVLVLGNEGSGLSKEVQASCQLLLTILPGRQLPSGLDSLNVSVAAARGRVSLQRRESNFSKTRKEPQPHQQGPEWLSTQDCPQNQNKRGVMGADLDCLR
ncbi:rRNA methyltransferase 1 [Prionailurus iriomotensis]